MESAIEDILRGDLKLTKRVSKLIKNSKALNELNECDKKLTVLLKKDSPKQELFIKFKNAMEENGADELAEYYKAGFCYGFRLALEVMNEDS